MGKKAVAITIIVILVFIIAYIAAISWDASEQQRYLNLGCRQVALGGAVETWQCPPGVNP